MRSRLPVVVIAVITVTLCLVVFRIQWQTSELKHIRLETAYINEHEDSVYMSLLKRAHICHENNFVSARKDTYGVGENERRKWTLIPALFEERNDIPECSSTQDVVEALNSGERAWEVENASKYSALELEQIPSFFKTKNCYLKFNSPEETCNILNKFAKVYIVGDSLARHMHQAMWISMSGDFILGGVPKSASSSAKDKCRCDGQFSEYSECRFYQPFMRTDVRDMGVCPNILSPTFTMEQFSSAIAENGTLPESGLNGLCVDDPRPLVVIFQGGLHHRYNSTMTIENYLRPNLKAIEERVRRCPKGTPRTHMIWVGPSIQTPALDQRYPSQREERANAFSAAMDSFLEENYPDVISLKFSTITKLSPTSDGVHKLTSANLEIVQALLKIMKNFGDKGTQQQ